MAVYVYFVFVLLPCVCFLEDNLLGFVTVCGFQRSNLLVSFERSAPVVFFTCLLLGAGEIMLGFVGITGVLIGICSWTGFVVADASKVGLGLVFSLSIVCIKLVWECLTGFGLCTSLICLEQES